jgi:tRNA(Ile2) C34 agmatinyltransferase TiaS
MAKVFGLDISPKIELRLSSVHLGILSILLILNATEIITMNSLLFKGLLFWVAINLLAFPVARKRFITPKIANPTCPFCGGNMITVELRCEKCNSSSKTPTEEK